MLPYMMGRCVLQPVVHLIVCISRIMEIVRQKNGVKYVAHNRVSVELLAGHHVRSILFFCRLCTLLKLIAKLNKVQRTGYIYYDKCPL